MNFLNDSANIYFEFDPVSRIDSDIISTGKPDESAQDTSDAVDGNEQESSPWQIQSPFLEHNIAMRDILKPSTVRQSKIQTFSDAIEEIRAAGDNWDEEFGTPGPTDEVLSLAKSIISAASEFNIYPKRVTQTVEEGICLVFQKNNSRMYLELYNSGEAGYIIEDFVKKTEGDNRDIEIRDILKSIVHHDLKAN